MNMHFLKQSLSLCLSLLLFSAPILHASPLPQKATLAVNISDAHFSVSAVKGWTPDADRHKVLADTDVLYKKIFDLVSRLNGRGVPVFVQGHDLEKYTVNKEKDPVREGQKIVEICQRYGVLKDPYDIRRVLQWKWDTLPTDRERDQVIAQKQKEIEVLRYEVDMLEKDTQLVRNIEYYQEIAEEFNKDFQSMNEAQIVEKCIELQETICTFTLKKAGKESPNQEEIQAMRIALNMSVRERAQKQVLVERFLQDLKVLDVITGKKRSIAALEKEIHGEKGIPLSGVTIGNAELLFDALFSKSELMTRYSKNNPLKVVLLRRGRSGRELTNILRKIPFVNVTVIVSGTDAGDAWYKGARLLKAPGIPGAGKTLVDLGNNHDLEMFLSHRLEIEGFDRAKIRGDFMRLISKLEDPSEPASIASPAFKKVRALCPKDDKLRLQIAAMFQGFLAELKEIGCEDDFDFDKIPLRTIALVGTYHNLKRQGQGRKPDEKYWQDAIDFLAQVLDVRDGNKVLLATDKRHQLIALYEDGTIALSESAINYYHEKRAVHALYLVDAARYRWDPAKNVNSIVDDNGNTLMELLAQQGVGVKRVRIKHKVRFADQVIATVKKVRARNVPQVAHVLSDLSTNMNSDKRKLIHLAEAPTTELYEADVVVTSGVFLESNAGGTLVVPGMKEALRVQLINPNEEDLPPSPVKGERIIITETLDQEAGYSVEYEKDHVYVFDGTTWQDKGLKRNDGAVKINFAEITDVDRADASAESVMDRIYQYVTQASNMPAGNKGEFVDYMIGGFSVDCKTEKLRNFGKGLELASGGSVSAVAIDARDSEREGFYVSPVLSQIVPSLAAVKAAGFKIAHCGKLFREKNAIDRMRWAIGQLGLFRNDPQVAQLVNRVSERLAAGPSKSAFVFDVDMTILPKGSKGLSAYQGFAYLFKLLLQDGVKVAIISGNSKSEQIKRIYKAIKKEMHEDKRALHNLTLYVNGGATKVTFDESGEIEDPNTIYNREFAMPLDVRNKLVEAVRAALVAQGDVGFGLNDEHISKFKELSQGKTKSFTAMFPWLEKGSSYVPMLLDSDEVDEKREYKGKDIPSPWIEERKSFEGYTASISVKPVPELKKYKKDPRVALIDSIIKELKTKGLDGFIAPRSGGSTTIDITLNTANKRTALADFIAINDLFDQAEHVYYFGDEMYKDGNDEVIAQAKVGGVRKELDYFETLIRQVEAKKGEEDTPYISYMTALKKGYEKLPEVTTVAVNDGKDASESKATIWIGRTPQATYEFFLAVLDEHNRLIEPELDGDLFLQIRALEAA